MRCKYLIGNTVNFNLLLGTFLAITLLMLPATTASAETPQLSDVSITDAVEDELFLDMAVPSHLIDVKTADGIVTLSGSVGNLLAKERAARVARIVKGVRAVVNNIDVDPPVLQMDSQIRADVEEALMEDPATDAYEVSVAVDDHVVTLTGEVNSWQEKNLCGKVAKAVKGVKELNNELEVVWSKDRSDNEIKAMVEDTLKWDAFVDHALIDVDVEGSKVILSGVVGSAAEKNEAYWEAHVYSVNSVDTSNLKVERWARDQDLRKDKFAEKSEEQIEDAVKDALFYDPRVSSFNITPEADAETDSVTLRGTVDNLKAKRAAEQDARSTVGVIAVDNRIKVRPSPLVSDEKIESRVRRSLLRDPYVNRYEITVDVINGVANLYGTVDTHFEKWQADDVASKVNGVIVVDNNLTVEGESDFYTYDPYVDSWYHSDFNPDYDRPRFNPKSDWRIEEDIESELWWSPFVDSDDVDVQVEDGIATLTGSVESWAEYNAAANNAYEGGAVFVENELNLE